MLDCRRIFVRLISGLRSDGATMQRACSTVSPVSLLCVTEQTHRPAALNSHGWRSPPVSAAFRRYFELEKNYVNSVCVGGQQCPCIVHLETASRRKHGPHRDELARWATP